MRHGNFNTPGPGAATALGIVNASTVPAGNDLAQTTIVSVPDFNKVVVEDEDVGAVDGDGLGFADEFHDYAARDVAMFVDVDGAFCFVSFGMRWRGRGGYLHSKARIRYLKDGTCLGVSDFVADWR